MQTILCRGKIQLSSIMLTPCGLPGMRRIQQHKTLLWHSLVLATTNVTDTVAALSQSSLVILHSNSSWTMPLHLLKGLCWDSEQQECTTISVPETTTSLTEVKRDRLLCKRPPSRWNSTPLLFPFELSLSLSLLAIWEIPSLCVCLTSNVVKIPCVHWY